MLEFLRKRAASWFIKFIVAAIAVVFVFWGIGGFSGSDKNYAIKIDNRIVTYQEYSKVYENLINNYKQLLKDDLTEEAIKKLNIKQQAVDAIIEKELLIREARKLKLRASDEEIRMIITQTPYFQRDGKFDKNLYLDILKMNRILPKDYEESQKETIMVSKMERFIVDSVKVSDEEVKQGYLSFAKKVKFGYVEFPYSAMQNEITVKDEELKGYYEKNKMSYKTSQSYSFEFVNLGSDTKKVDEAKKELEKNRDINEFAKKNKLKLETVLYRPDMKGNLWQKSLLNKFSISLKTGEISEPVKTPSGFQVYRLVSKIEEKIPVFEEVKDRVIVNYVKESAKKLAEKKGDELIKKIKSSNEAYKGKETEYLSVSENLPDVLEPKKMEIFKLSKNKRVLEEPVIGAESVAVIWFIDKKFPEPVNEEIQKYRRAYVDFKKQEVLKSYIENLKKNAKISINEQIM